MQRRNKEAEARHAARRDREDQAVRLKEVIPGLHTLKIRLEESRPARGTEVSIVKHVVVGRAPAHFELPCTDKKCPGSHDVTSPILDALQDGAKEFSGEHNCSCDRTLHFRGEADYEAA